MTNQEYQKIPGVDTLLQDDDIKTLIQTVGDEVVKYSVRNVLNRIRKNISNDFTVPSYESIKSDIVNKIHQLTTRSLKQIVNATGIVLHTNFGRAPLGEDILNEIIPVISGYSNLEFDLSNGVRGNRNKHLSELIKFITGAENSVVVNNNAAGLSLAINTFAKNKEIIISRGELIEIGGSFRIPDIIEASGGRMIEVGTTNRTKLSDYENAINDNTSMILKIHKSNYYIDGYTESVELPDLAHLRDKHNLILFFDLGAGLLRKSQNKNLLNEPDVKSSIESGADLVAFSCDKLIGGPQAGIIAGNSNLIQQLSKAPLMRTFRVGKFTIALLQAIFSKIINSEKPESQILINQILNRPKNEVENNATKLKFEFENLGIKVRIEQTVVQFGGGTLPQEKFDSYAVSPTELKEKRQIEELYKNLLLLDKPVVGILREGRLLFDIFAVSTEDLPYIAKSVRDLL